MPEAPKQRRDSTRRRLAAIDQMLLAAMQQGPAKKREAINRILELVPNWTRGDCWRRIRQLRKHLASNESECSVKARRKHQGHVFQFLGRPEHLGRRLRTMPCFG